ncbi:MAG: hypothetical protein MHMPM18_000295 [Marteilia pararefringens]
MSSEETRQYTYFTFHNVPIKAYRGQDSHLKYLLSQLLLLLVSFIVSLTVVRLVRGANRGRSQPMQNSD